MIRALSNYIVMNMVQSYLRALVLRSVRFKEKFLRINNGI